MLVRFILFNAGLAVSICKVMHSKILIIDFGSQVTQLIARRVREAGVFSEVYPYDVSDEFVRNYGASGIILSGGPNSVTEGDTPRAPQAVFEAGVPVLGICYGMQTMAEQLGGKVENGLTREFGYAEVRMHGHTALFKDISDFKLDNGQEFLKVWMSHGDKVNTMPAGFKLMASTDNCPIAGMADEARRFYAVQFHPEVTHTLKAKKCWSVLCWVSVAVKLIGICQITSLKQLKRFDNKSAQMKSSLVCLVVWIVVLPQP
jgi:GMP synthase (glutamine-hydrolysing)